MNYNIRQAFLFLKEKNLFDSLELENNSKKESKTESTMCSAKMQSFYIPAPT